MSFKISLKFVPKVQIDNIPALVQIMAWRRSGDKPLYEPMMVSLLTHICVTRPQWVNVGFRYWSILSIPFGVNSRATGQSNCHQRTISQFWQKFYKSEILKQMLHHIKSVLWLFVVLFKPASALVCCNCKHFWLIFVKHILRCLSTETLINRLRRRNWNCIIILVNLFSLPTPPLSQGYVHLMEE